MLRMSKVAIMQPYLFPYIGYFQLLNAVERFVLYDNIQYTKRGWINRNKFLRNGEAIIFSLPLAGAAEGLDIRDRFVSANFNKDKFLNPLRESYRKAPYYEGVMALVERVARQPESNLFKFLYFSILETCRYIELDREIIISSTLDLDHTLHGQDKVMAICQHLGASTYVNPIGGLNLYSKEYFAINSIDLRFLKASEFEYEQAGSTFVPWLSIIDVLMFNSPAQIKQQIESGFQLI